MSLAVCEVKCWENRLLAEKTGPLSCQVYSSPVYKGCRHIFCIVSRFLFGRICVLHTSKELDPNHYNETFSIRNRHDIINYRESIWLFHHGFGNAVKFQYQLVSSRPMCLVGDCFWWSSFREREVCRCSQVPIWNWVKGGFHSVFTRIPTQMKHRTFC